MRIFSTLCFGCFIVASASAQVQLATKKSISAVRIHEQVTLDAKLDEPAWKDAPIATDFVLAWPTPGKPSKQRTIVKVLYDDFAIYVGAYCYDTHPDSIFHRFSKRDQLENCDNFSFTIDAYRDGQNAVEFGVSPDNVQFDNKYSIANADSNNGNNDGQDPAWDAVWRSAAHINPDGWVAEFEIPYSALRFPKKDVQEWGVNFFRNIKRFNEFDSWNEIKAEINGSLSQMGIMTGVENVKAPLRLSATPFLATYANNVYNQPTGPGSGWAYPYSVGMDVKYGINEAFTLDATVIPDFGQVRTDNYVLNLSPFEVRYNENRPFFTEGTELFNKGGLFYSRRIGANAKLLNAMKISGRTKNGLGIGVFNAVEDAAYDLTTDSDGHTVKTEASPLTNSNILVLDQNLKNNSSVTLINTNVTRSGAATDANVTGLLFNLRDKAQHYGLNGQMVVSNRFNPGAVESGYNASVDLSKINGNFLWGMHYAIKSANYNPNDLGYLPNANENGGFAYINYNRYKPWWILNNFWTSLWVYNGLLYQPAVWVETQFGGNFGCNTKSFHNMGINFQVSPNGANDYYEPRVYDFKHFYHVPVNSNVSFWYNTDNRKQVTLHVDGGARFFQQANRLGWRISPSIRWRASNKLTLSTSISFERSTENIGGLDTSLISKSSVGYEKLPQKPILMAHRDGSNLVNDFGVNYAFNTRLNLSFYARHYWNRVFFKSFDILQADGSLVPSAYTGKDVSQHPLNDIAANYFNIDMVFTWRFAPGSDILIVYKNLIRHDADGLDVNHDYFYNARHLPSFEGSNSISFKILYYLDYSKIKKWF
jgi:hypothetical protein